MKQLPTNRLPQASLQRRLRLRTSLAIVPCLTALPRAAATNEGDPSGYYLYTPELQLLAETTVSTSTGKPIAYSYLWFGGQPVASIEAATNTTRWYTTDHLGTPLLQTDTSGAVVWRAELTPYGDVFNFGTGAAVHQPLRLPGQIAQDGSALYYNVFRWYRGGWGRYTQKDPLGLRETETTLFRYALGNPTNDVDPLGLISLAQGAKCASFDRGLNTLNKLKKNCKCTGFFRDQWGVDYGKLVDSPNPVVKIVTNVGDGTTDCSTSTTSFNMSNAYCGRLAGFAGETGHILLHELAHIADCALNRYPPGGPSEEGIAAEVACFGDSIDLRYDPRNPPKTLPPLNGPWK